MQKLSGLLSQLLSKSKLEDENPAITADTSKADLEVVQPLQVHKPSSSAALAPVTPLLAASF